MIELLLQAERALSVGLLDRADVLYRQVAKADPRNSIAVVGLARVTLDRGDDIQALALARKALAIDPENTAAQRMVARLEEVLDFRDAARDLDAQPATGNVAEAETAAEPLEPEIEAEPVEAEPVEPAAGPAVIPPKAVEADAAAAPDAEPTTGAGADTFDAPEMEPARSPESAPEPEPERSREPAEPRRRSWLDRLFGRP